MVSAKRRSRKTEGVLFVPPPWNEETPEYQAVDRELPADHLARKVVQAMERLDLTGFLASYRGQGSLPYRPDLLLRAVLYEMRQGRHKPTEWFRDARESQPVRWLLRGGQPCRACWYAFRDRVGPWLEQWNQGVLTQAVEQQVTPAERGALDGTLTAAHASRHRLVKEATLQQRVEQLDQAVAADQNSAAPVPGPYWLAKTAWGRRRQQQRYQQAQKRMEAMQQRNQQKRASKRQKRDKIVVSVSDPQAALGRDKLGVYRPLYNVQLIDDLDSPLILGYGVFAQPNDNNTLGPMLERQAHLVGHKLKELLADAGYASGPHLAIAEAAGVTLYAPWQENDFTAAKGKKPALFPKARFRWLAEEQTYQCPQGHRLEKVSSSRQKRSGTETVRLDQYRCPPVHCGACPLAKQCTSNPEAGRTISRSEHEELIEALKVRMETAEAKALYRLRRQTVELVYADMKEHRCLRRFSGRGLQRAETEVGLLMLAHNLLTRLAARPAVESPGKSADIPEKIAA